MFYYLLLSLFSKLFLNQSHKIIEIVTINENVRIESNTIANVMFVFSTKMNGEKIETNKIMNTQVTIKILKLVDPFLNSLFFILLIYNSGPYFIKRSIKK